MAIRQERYYNIAYLHRWFGISAILLLIFTVWMLVKDGQREWKPYRQAFRKLEIQKLQDAYTREQKRLSEKNDAAAKKQVLLLQSRLQKISPEHMDWGNRLAESVRNIPLLDGLHPSYQIEQVVLHEITDDIGFTKTSKVDRCMTCHQGVLNQEFANDKSPYKTHPRLDLFLSPNSPHPLDKFGCTSCHQGKGRGLDFVSAAHTPVSAAQRQDWETKYGWHPLDHWETQMYSLNHVEAGCFKCHANETEIAGANKLNLGLNLIEKAQCGGCHYIGQYPVGGKRGPNLTHLKHKLGDGDEKKAREWAYFWVQSPKKFRPHAWMHAFFGQSNNSDPASKKRTDQEVHAMVYYLFESSKNLTMADPPVAGDVHKGEEIVMAVGCLGCHKIEYPLTQEVSLTLDSLKGEYGPNLAGIGNKTSAKWIYNWVKNPYFYHPGTKMPNLRLTDEESAHVAAYLKSLQHSAFQDLQLPALDADTMANITFDFLRKNDTEVNAHFQMKQMNLNAQLLYTGKKLIGNYGCSGCHEIPGFEKKQFIGPDLTNIGSKPLTQLDFGFVDLTRTNHTWLTQKIKDPRIFDKGRIRPFDERAKMPSFWFSKNNQEVEAIVTALLGFVKEKPLPSRIKPQTKKNITLAQGQRLVREFNCQGCHRIGEGDSSPMEPAVEQWLTKFHAATLKELVEVQKKKAVDAFSLFTPPNLKGEGARAQAIWLFDYFKGPTPIRTRLRMHMPTFPMNDHDVNTIVGYLSFLSQEEFPFVPVIDSTMSLDEEQGARLMFSENYLFCGSCHLIGDRVPSVQPENRAPNLAFTKQRLKGRWVVQWLYHPQAMLARVPMPNFFGGQNLVKNILQGDEKLQIRALRDYVLALSDCFSKLRYIAGHPQEPFQLQDLATPTMLLDTLRYISGPDRVALTKLLGQTKDKALLTAAVQILDDELYKEYQAASELLVSAGDAGMAVVLEAMKNAKKAAAGRMADVLKEIGTPVLPGVTALLRTSESVALKKVIIKLLGDLQDPKVVPDLVKLLKDPKLKKESKEALKLISDKLPPNNTLRKKIQQVLEK